MYGLVFMVMVCICYIATFKEDFTKEKIDKVFPFIIVVAILVLIITILLNL